MKPRFAQHPLVAVALLLLPVSHLPAPLAAESLELPEGFPLWQHAGSVGVGFGYKDNLTLSHVDPPDSAFEIASAEVMLFRLPWNNWQISLMAVGSDTRYFDPTPDVDAEQNAAVSGEFVGFLGRGWKSISTLRYAFLNQVMDVSATYGTSLPQQVLGHGLTFEQGIRNTVGSWWAGLDVSGSRYVFREPLDDYWQAGPQVRVGHYYGQGSELSLSYQVSPLLYDTREKVDATGAPLSGTSLRYLPQTVELAWIQVWDEPRRWQSTTRLSFESSQDNGTGYYDYTQYRVAEQLRYRAGGWELSAEASVAWFEFPNQPVSLVDAQARQRTSVHAAVRGQRQLSRHWRLYAAYDYEQSLSNRDTDRYKANTVSGGIEFEF
ncbi:MAG TPA: hypothetical protein PKJ98_20735 [Verrucomicrobiota bacterium]|nr:hypothetical protein [Verrucomicrobiota bacterium]